MTSKKFFYLDNIYSSKTWLCLLADITFLSAGCLILILLLGDFNGEEADISIEWDLAVLIIGLAIVFSLGYATRSILQTIYAGKLIRRREYIGQANLNSKTLIHSSSAINAELNKVDWIGLIIEQDNLKIYDTVFEFYRRSKFGKYKSKEAYYTVFEARLKRTIPHLLFDSKLAKRRQFKRLYLKAQSIPLAAGFEDSFEAYAPKHYQIDTLSFITPEVIEAMLAMKEYDIEFIGDSLLCYAPLLEQEKLKAFQSKCLNLLSCLNDHLGFYQDSHLEGAKKKTEVTDFGKELLKNPWRSLPMTVLFGIMTIAVFVFSILNSWNILFNALSLTIIGLFVLFLADILLVAQSNRKKEAAFLAR